MRASVRVTSLAFLGLVGLTACDDAGPSPPDLTTACGTITDSFRFPPGAAEGHADPAGAKAAGQARAGRVTSTSMIRQAADARHPVRVGDYLLANDKIALYVEGARPTDGYTYAGGEVLAIDVVGDDGYPVGRSVYGESILTLQGLVVTPEQVTVIADGSDGGPAIVRSSGTYKPLAFLEAFSGILGERFEFPAAIDYVLAPGAESVQLRLRVANTRNQPYSLENALLLGFFHTSRGQVFTDTRGYAPPAGPQGFVAWDAGDSVFAFRPRGGETMSFLLEQSRFQLFASTGDQLPACQESELDFAELIPAASIDALRETVRRIDGEPAHRAVAVTVLDASAAPVAGALVHVVDGSGRYLTRGRTGADGVAQVHAPGAETSLYVTAPGYTSAPATALGAAAATATVTLGATGIISIDAKEAGSLRALPVRVQVLPVDKPAPSPEAFGVEDAIHDRLHQVYAVGGKVDLVVPAGDHRVVVSRGWEYELDDRTVTVAAGATVAIAAELAHSVDTTGALCADFHIHSFYSADSSDPVVDKVRHALAEGVDVPVSSEHEYVVDFQPVIEQLGMTTWARGLSSEELTTWTWGHFGVVPKLREEAERNRGALEWANRGPAEVFAEVHALPEQPALIVNHPYSNGFIGYFSATSFDAATGMGDPSLFSDDFDAIEVYNDSTFDQNRDESVKGWFALLARGKRVFSVGSSDSHFMATSPVGYPRTCLQLGHDDPAQVTAEAVRDAIKAGTSTIDGGLYLTVTGPGGVRPGGTISGASGTLSFDVAVQAPSWITAEELEVFVDGQSVQTIALTPSVVVGPGQRWDAPVDVTIPATTPPGGFHFIVFHARSSQELLPLAPGRHAFAASNPIFF